jgi:hypothetical protein
MLVKIVRMGCHLLALQVCDVAVLTQLKELLPVGLDVFKGDLQPLSTLQNLVVFDWRLKGGLIIQHDWTEASCQQAQRWSHTVQQAVQQWLAPSWTKLTSLHLDTEMDRATLQTVASHCPQLVCLGCSTLCVKESQPQIQLPSLRGLAFTFNMTGGTCSTPVPVSTYAALRTPVLEEICIVEEGKPYVHATVSSGTALSGWLMLNSCRPLQCEMPCLLLSLWAITRVCNSQAWCQPSPSCT